MEPWRFREIARQGQFQRPTCGVSTGYVQANLIVLAEKYADDFEAFCRANSRPCPLLERLPPGEFLTSFLATRADLRHDLPRYLFHLPKEDKPRHHLGDLWTKRTVAFLLGCSFTFEGALEAAGLSLRHVEQGSNVPMYRTNRPLTSVGPFRGNLVVSMRPFPSEEAERIYAITGEFPRTHGAPVHHGSPEELGIKDLGVPDWGDPVPLEPGEVPFFWACGVTSQEACNQAMQAGKLSGYASHAPGYMFVGDIRNEDLKGSGENAS
jgi:uncharacterized protein YcsI (UPF0317 family)